MTIDFFMPGRASRRLVGALRESIGERRQVPWGEVRSSGLPYLCPREIALRKDVGLVESIENRPEPSLAWIFGIGTAMHTQFQEEWLKSLGPVFQGWWRCKDCNRLHRGPEVDAPALSHGWIPAPDKCEGCGSTAGFRYEELEFHNEEYGLTGHCDGVLVWGDRTEIFELKTVNGYAFDHREPYSGGPDPKHVIQANAYMWMSGIPNVRIVYQTKQMDTTFEEALHEHELSMDDAIVGRIKLLLSDAAKARSGDGHMFNRHVECKTARSKKAKRCPVGTLCFKTEVSCTTNASTTDA